MLAAALLWLLVGPRVELPSLDPLRVEDLVFALLAVLVVRHARSLLPQRAMFLAVLGVVATGLVSAVAAAARGTVPLVGAVFYAVRPLEYCIAFPAALLVLRGLDPSWQRRMDTILAVTTVLQTTFAVLQYYFSLPIGFSHAAYTRAAGLTVGPYELGAISAALAVYWVSRGRWVLVSLSVVALAASVARISVVGGALGIAILAVVWIVRQTGRIRRTGWRAAFRPYVAQRLRFAVQVLAVGTAGLVLAFTLGVIKLPETPAQQAGAAAQSAPAASEDAPSATPTPTAGADSTTPALPSAPAESVTTRLADTSVLGSWNAATGLAAAVYPLHTAAEYQNIAYAHLNDYVNANNASTIGAEASNLVRFFRWHLILDTMREPVNVVLGLGPSFVGPSVDGSYLRFYADGGILGVLAWLVLIVMWLRRSPLWMVCVSLSMLVGAVFIDLLYAERPMVLFWALLAIAAAARERRTAQPRTSGRPAVVHTAAVPATPTASRPDLVVAGS